MWNSPCSMRPETINYFVYKTHHVPWQYNLGSLYGVMFQDRWWGNQLLQSFINVTFWNLHWYRIKKRINTRTGVLCCRCTQCTQTPPNDHRMASNRTMAFPQHTYMYTQFGGWRSETGNKHFESEGQYKSSPLFSLHLKQNSSIMYVQLVFSKNWEG